jgi:hypothetical protein
LVLFQKRRREVGNQLNHLLGLPLVFALVVVDAVLGVAQQLARCASWPEFPSLLGPRHKAHQLFQKAIGFSFQRQDFRRDLFRLRSGLCW